MSRLTDQRNFFAEYVTAKGGVHDERLKRAFQAVDRALYCGPGPWWVAALEDYVQTPSDDPAFVYQDVVIALIRERGINNGEPSLHARCLSAVAIHAGEHVTHVGAGTGYYTALLSELTGPDGRVTAYEIEPDLAELACRNLRHIGQVDVRARSGTQGELPPADVVYVSAGATEPLAIWLDSLKPGGRLIFPLTPDHGFGGMLLVTRRPDAEFDAQFVSPALFFPCAGARQPSTARLLWDAFKRGNEHPAVRSLRRAGVPDRSCWARGEGWWLSTNPPN